MVWRLSARVPGAARRCPVAVPGTGCFTAVTAEIGVYSMYMLFSQQKTTGSFHTAARFSASRKAPMLVAPLPKKVQATCFVSRYCADHAAPAAIGRCAPTQA